MKTLSILFFLAGMIPFLPAQTPVKKWQVHQSFSDTSSQFFHIRIDTILGDTGKYARKSHRYLEVTKEGIEIIDGHWRGGMSSPCGCIVKPHGYWIERYRNGNLKEQGTYFCNEKIGTWIYYHENGQIAKVEHLKEPYETTFFQMAEGLGIRLDNRPIREGAYLEYYPNGQIKVDGFYVIGEAFSTTDTVFTADPDTYELTGEVIEGAFWLPASFKTGHWNEYTADGRLVSHEYNKKIKWDRETNRPLVSRYYELHLAFMEKRQEEQKE
jgi:hypothetical protein